MSTETSPIHPGDERQTEAELTEQWATGPRWSGVRRDYSTADVVALRAPLPSVSYPAGQIPQAIVSAPIGPFQ